ncbi:hypothetical protein GQ457_18G018910 [Hibiscus cannabinus]
MGAEGDSSELRVGTIGGEDEGVMVNIRCSSGTKFTVRTSLESTVGVFKSVLAQNCDVPADQQRLIYKGRILKDDQTLQSYGLQADHTVHMVRGFAPSSSVSPPAATTNVGTPNTTPGVTRGVVLMRVLVWDYPHSLDLMHLGEWRFWFVWIWTSRI